MFFDTTKKDCEELKQYINIPVNTHFSLYHPKLIDAEEIVVNEVTGETFYQNLLEKYEANQLTMLEAKLVKKVKAAIACTAHILRLPETVTRVDAIGMVQPHTENHKAASKGAVNLTLKTAGETAEKKINQLFELLEQEAAKESPEQIIWDWIGSSGYSVNHLVMVHSAVEFTKHYAPLKNSRSAYKAFIDDIVFVENQYIKPTLGNEVFNLIKEQFRTNTLTEDSRKILELCRPAICCFAIAEGLEMKGFGVLDANGNPTMPMFELSETKGQAVSEKTLTRLVNAARKRAERHLKTLKEFLHAKPDADQSTVGKSIDTTDYQSIISI